MGTTSGSQISFGRQLGHTIWKDVALLDSGIGTSLGMLVVVVLKQRPGIARPFRLMPDEVMFELCSVGQSGSEACPGQRAHWSRLPGQCIVDGYRVGCSDGTTTPNRAYAEAQEDCHRVGRGNTPAGVDLLLRVGCHPIVRDFVERGTPKQVN